VHADLGFALAKQAWLARADLRLVVMSATLDAARVAEYLDGCPIVEVPGTLHPLDVRYAPGVALADAVGTCLRERAGQVLCFLPGAAEIARARREVTSATEERGTLVPRQLLEGRLAGVEIVDLHGSLDAAAQDAAIAVVPHRRVILATNLAETSLTVPGVSAVVDTGFHKVSRYDPDRAIDSLETERISRDAADQRAGRAGRLGPGLVVRLWHRSDRLRTHREPEIHRIDLSGAILDILAWGGDPRSFDWFEAPKPAAVDAGFELLERLGAAEAGRLTDLGRRMQPLPLNPRLSAILLAAGGAREAAVACALLSERYYQPSASNGYGVTTTSDLLAAVARERELPQPVLRAAANLQSLVRARSGRSIGESDIRRALLAGYPDRVGRRRTPGSPRVLLASGHGAVIGSESDVRAEEFLVALDVTAGKRGEGSEARIRLASVLDREWLTPTSTRVEHALDQDTGSVRAVSREYYGAIVLAERPATSDPTEAQRLLVDAFLVKPLSSVDEQIVRRLRFAGIPTDIRLLAERAVEGCRTLRDLDIRQGLTADERLRLSQSAPETVDVPSGRHARLEYQEDGSVTSAIKLQELFGLADTPRVGPRREPVLLELLAPNGRPVQVTRDLRSFWERTYPEVRKELRGRYPKHPWPEDPWTAVPTARTTKRGALRRRY